MKATAYQLIFSLSLGLSPISFQPSLPNSMSSVAVISGKTNQIPIPKVSSSGGGPICKSMAYPIHPLSRATSMKIVTLLIGTVLMGQIYLKSYYIARRIALVRVRSEEHTSELQSREN